MLFTSDNWAPVHPAIMARLGAVNHGAAPAYGTCPVSAEAERALSHLFEGDVVLAHVATGSAANALALATLTPPWGAVLAHPSAHIMVDECGAPEFFTGGAKLVDIPAFADKVTPSGLAEVMAFFTPRLPHHVVPTTLSLTQATEHGTVYSLAELRVLVEAAKAHGLRVHLDGARLANACAALKVGPAALTRHLGIDAVSFGGTKNGALAAELVVFFDPAYADELRYRQKRAGQVLSKGRYLAAQWLALLDDGLWLRLAEAANAAARRLAEGLVRRADVSLAFPAEINEVFVLMDDALAQRLRDAGARFYDWIQPRDPHGGRLRRFVTHYATQTEEIDAFLELLARA